MSFQVEFVDGSRIEATGENQFPKNFDEVFSELDDLTAEAREAFYEEQTSFWALCLYHFNQLHRIAAA